MVSRPSLAVPMRSDCAPRAAASRREQIKLMGGGGVASPYNPIESTQYTEAEIRARWRRRELGHIRHGSRLHAARRPAGASSRRKVHRAWASRRRRDRRDDGREGCVGELQPLLGDEDGPRWRTPCRGRRRRRSMPGPRTPMSWPGSTGLDRLRHRCAVRCGSRPDAGSTAGKARPLVLGC